MESLIHAFGIDVKLIIVQIINFVILVGVLSYFLYKPVLKLLNDREERIKKGIEDAESAAKAKESADQEKQTILAEAQQNAESVVSRAEVHAKDKAGEIVTSAENRAVDIIKNAENNSVEIKDKARAESEAEIAKLAVLAAEKVLKEQA